MYFESKLLAFFTRDGVCGFHQGSFRSFGHQDCRSLRIISLIGLVLPPALGGSCGWPFLGYDAFVLKSEK